MKKIWTSLLVSVGLISTSNYAGAYDLITSKATVKLPESWRLTGSTIGSLTKFENNLNNSGNLNEYEKEVYKKMMESYLKSSDTEKLKLFEKILLNSDVSALMDGGKPTDRGCTNG